MRSRVLLPVLVALAAALAGGCSSSGSGADPAASAGSPPATPTEKEVSPGTSFSAGSGVSPVNRRWKPYTERFFVWGVAADDVLNVRSKAGVDQPIIARLAPGARGIRLFDVARRIGREQWSPIKVRGGAGWVNVRYLRPVGPDTPAVRGARKAAIVVAAREAADALHNRDLARLAAMVDPAQGVTVSPGAFVQADAVVLTGAQVRNAAGNPKKLLWGYTDGEGAPIRETVVERLRKISGRTALTSTSMIGYDVRLGVGNSFDNISKVFPGARVVEYHFAGTSRHGAFDWTSVRFVFSANGSPPTLVAIIEDTWTT